MDLDFSIFCPRATCNYSEMIKYNYYFIAAPDDVAELTAEIVEKMEHFKVGQEKVSALKTVAIKLEVKAIKG